MVSMISEVRRRLRQDEKRKVHELSSEHEIFRRLGGHLKAGMILLVVKSTNSLSGPSAVALIKSMAGKNMERRHSRRAYTNKGVSPG